MRFIITENQFNNAMDSESMKKVFFKYWNKFGGEINNHFIRMFGFNNGRLDSLIISDVRQYLVEWRGFNESIKLTKDIIENNPHKIGGVFDCGGYNFTFDLSINDTGESDMFYVNVKIDKSNPDNTVVMIYDGNEMQLGDAISNDDFGWEVENEVQDCVFDYIEYEITNKTGIPVNIYKMIFE